jgi:hypothetical protein
MDIFCRELALAEFTYSKWNLLFQPTVFFLPSAIPPFSVMIRELEGC